MSTNLDYSVFLNLIFYQNYLRRRIHQSSTKIRKHEEEFTEQSDLEALIMKYQSDLEALINSKGTPISMR